MPVLCGPPAAHGAAGAAKRGRAPRPQPPLACRSAPRPLRSSTTLEPPRLISARIHHRSQPPLYSEMVRIVYEQSGNRTQLRCASRPQRHQAALPGPASRRGGRRGCPAAHVCERLPAPWPNPRPASPVLRSRALPALLREHEYWTSSPKQARAALRTGWLRLRLASSRCGRRAVPAIPARQQSGAALLAGQLRPCSAPLPALLPGGCAGPRRRALQRLPLLCALAAAAPRVVHVRGRWCVRLCRVV